MRYYMLRCVCVLSFWVLLITQVQADAIHAQIQPLSRSSLLLDIAPAGDALVVAGERGHILRLVDNQWQQVATPVSTLLTKIFFVDERHGWAVGHDATIIHTADGGLTWTTQMQSEQMEKPFLDVLFFDKNRGVAIGAYGLFYRSLDGGQTWTEEFHDELLADEDAQYLSELKQQDLQLYNDEKSYLLPHFNRLVRLRDGRLLLLGELGLVAISDDQGRTFESLDFVYEGSMFNGIEIGDKIYLMGLRGNLYSTDQQFSQFTKLTIPVSATINSAIQTKDGNVWFVGNAGMILKMTDDGMIHEMAKRQGESLVAIIQDKQDRLWLSGTAGVLQFQPE